MRVCIGSQKKISTKGLGREERVEVVARILRNASWLSTKNTNTPYFVYPIVYS